jgi:hypothetical protein
MGKEGEGLEEREVKGKGEGEKGDGGIKGEVEMEGGRDLDKEDREMESDGWIFEVDGVEEKGERDVGVREREMDGKGEESKESGREGGGERERDEGCVYPIGKVYVTHLKGRKRKEEEIEAFKARNRMK